MSTKLYIGNLPFDVTENDLRDMLAQHGPVNEINVIMDKRHRPRTRLRLRHHEHRGRGQGRHPGLNGKDWKGRALTVNEARPREERRPRGGGAAAAVIAAGSAPRY